MQAVHHAQAVRGAGQEVAIALQRLIQHFQIRIAQRGFTGDLRHFPPGQGGLGLVTARHARPLVGPRKGVFRGQFEDRVKVGAGVEVGNHAARGGHGHVEKAIFAGDAPDRDEAAHDDAAIEEVAVVLADAGGRGMFEGERLQAVVPGVVAEERRGQTGAVENLFISRYVMKKDERAGRVPGDFGGNRLVFF